MKLHVINRLSILSNLLYKLSNKPLIVSTGIARSGSTLMYNILREILEIKWGPKLSSAWEGDIKDLNGGELFLIKTHSISFFYRMRAKHMFFTYRDVRTSAISKQKKFGTKVSFESIEADINSYILAKKKNTISIKYEDLISNPITAITTLANTLNIDVVADEIRIKAFNLQPPKEGINYSKKTLLHYDHFTYTKDDEWREIIPIQLQHKINNKFDWWFRECGYPPD